MERKRLQRTLQGTQTQIVGGPTKFVVDTSGNTTVTDVQNANGNTSVGGTLTVTGITTLSGTLTVNSSSSDLFCGSISAPALSLR